MEVNSDIFEEYELPSDDAVDEKEHYSDGDSTVDVSIVLCTIHKYTMKNVAYSRV